MGLMSRFLGQENAVRRHSGEQTYLDLGEMEANGPAPEPTAWMKIAELNKLEDFKEFAHHVYDGHILVVDIRKIANDEILLRRFIAEARRVATDVQGDVAGIAEGLVAVTPRGVAIGKQKIRAAQPPK